VTVALIAATAVGARHAAHLAGTLPAAAVVAGSPREALAAVWPKVEAVVLCMATGAAVRLIAPLLGDKHTDPPVVAVDDGARFAVAVTGGHHGANDLARRIAASLGATPVVTTASDVLGLPSLDSLGAAFGLRIDPALADTAAVGAALVAGAPVAIFRSHPWPTGPLPPTITRSGAPSAPGLLVTDEVLDSPRPSVVYRPRSLVVGVGASRGVTAQEVGALIDLALRTGGLSPLSVAHIATVDAKAEEAGILEAAAARGWPVVTYPAAVLGEVAVPNPSPVVEAAVGTASVAEAAALVQGGELLVAKRTLDAGGRPAQATVAIARRPVRGRLALVSTGPGDPRLVPPMAREALADAELVLGLDQYVDRVRGFLLPGTDVADSAIGDEVARAEEALSQARRGRSVALLSGGDVGVYAMASPALERAGDDVDVVVVPGVTAAVAAAALLGSPLGHDHCAISLSDLLTPFEVIRRRVKAAAEGDFVVSLYNPRSRGRRWQLEEVRQLLLEHRKPETPVGVVSDAFRPGQRVEITSLVELDPAAVDMLTIVLVGSSQTRVVAGRMVTPRGYA